MLLGSSMLLQHMFIPQPVLGTSAMGILEAQEGEKHSTYSVPGYSQIPRLWQFRLRSLIVEFQTQYNSPV